MRGQQNIKIAVYVFKYRQSLKMGMDSSRNITAMQFVGDELVYSNQLYGRCTILISLF